MALKYLPQAERLLSGTLSTLLTDSATTMTVSNPPSASKLPTYIEIDPDSTADRETVRVTDVSGSVCTIERGVYTGGVGVEHQSNTPYKQKITQKHWDALVAALQAGYLPEDSSLTFTRNSTSIFRVNGIDNTAYYTSGRIVRLNGSVVVTVLSSAYSGGNTVVTCNETTVPTPITAVEIAVGPIGSLDLYITPASTNTLTNKTYTSPKIGTAILDTSGNELLKLTNTSSAVNELTLANAATGNNPTLSATGGDTDISIEITPKGTGRIKSATVNIPTISSTDTFTNKRWTRRVLSTNAPGATPTINTDNYDVAHFTGLNTAITSMTTNLTGTPVEGDVLRMDFTDDGTARAITFGSKFEASGTVALPTTTVLGVRLDTIFLWNTVTSKWRCVGVA